MISYFINIFVQVSFIRGSIDVFNLVYKGLIFTLFILYIYFYRPSGRSAALKATESIQSMMRPNYNSGRATSTTKLAANMTSGSAGLKQK